MNLLGTGNCPAGQIFCADGNGDAGCTDASLCNQRIDPNQDCNVDGNDFNRAAGVDNGIQGTEVFGSVPIGPFEP